MDFNYPCKCGHKKEQHSDINYQDRTCWFEYPANSGRLNPIFPCKCQKFKADNLKYLELMSEKKGKLL